MLAIMARRRRVDSTSPPRCTPIGRLESVHQILSRSLHLNWRQSLIGSSFYSQGRDLAVRVTVRDA